MNDSAFHLNLLKPAEHVSSSPVRLRVIAPMLAFFAILGMVVWWASLFTQILLVKADQEALAADNAAQNDAVRKARALQNEFAEKEAQLRQLQGYAKGVRRFGPALAALAVDFPMEIQLTELSIAPLPAQDLRPNKKNAKAPPLRGPTNTIERQTFTLRGRTRDADLIDHDLLRILSREDLKPLYSGLEQPRTFSTAEAATEHEATKPFAASAPILSFTVDYPMVERSFAAPPAKGARK